LESHLKKKGPDNKDKGAGKRRNQGKGGDKPQTAGKQECKLPAWKTKKTEDVITRKDDKSGKTTTYYWCPHHGYYMVHKPADCSKAQADSKPAAQANAAVVQDAVHNVLEALQADE
jgi:hypothetical protein